MWGGEGATGPKRTVGVGKKGTRVARKLGDYPKRGPKTMQKKKEGLLPEPTNKRRIEPKDESGGRGGKGREGVMLLFLEPWYEVH